MLLDAVSKKLWIFLLPGFRMIHILNCNVLELLLFYLKITYLLFCKPNASTIYLNKTTFFQLFHKSWDNYIQAWQGSLLSYAICLCCHAMCLQSTKKRKDTLGLAFVNISSCEWDKKYNPSILRFIIKPKDTSTCGLEATMVSGLVLVLF